MFPNNVETPRGQNLTTEKSRVDEPLPWWYHMRNQDLLRTQEFSALGTPLEATQEFMHWWWVNHVVAPHPLGPRRATSPHTCRSLPPPPQMCTTSFIIPQVIKPKHETRTSTRGTYLKVRWRIQWALLSPGSTILWGVGRHTQCANKFASVSFTRDMERVSICPLTVNGKTNRLPRY